MYTIAYSFLGIIGMIFLQLPLYIYYKRKDKEKDADRMSARAILLKGSITLVAVLFGGAAWYAFAAEKTTPPGWFVFSFWPVIGLIVCMLADIILEIAFLAGMGLFFLGHICYILYFIQIADISLQSVFLFILTESIMVTYFLRFRKKLGRTTPAYLLYGSLILVTFSIGAMLPFTAGESGLLPAMAAVMLVISDYMLAYQIIVKRSDFREVVLLGFYWGGQFLMAMSIFYPVFLYCR